MTQAGRDLDALVAEKVMGLPVVWSEEPYILPGRPRKEGRHPYLKGTSGGVEYDWAEVKRYSTDIAAAWLVRERMHELGWRFHLSQHGDQIWNCRFTPEDTAAYQYAVDQSPFVAICLAALKAMEENPR